MSAMFQRVAYLEMELAEEKVLGDSPWGSPPGSEPGGDEGLLPLWAQGSVVGARKRCGAFWLRLRRHK